MQKMVTVIGLVLLVSLAGCEPMGPLPGGKLEGTTESPPRDWASSSEFEVMQIETRPESPYSINIWAVDIGDSIYIASASGDQTEWVSHIKAEPLIRLRIDETIYELKAVRVSEPEELAQILDRYIEKYDYQSDAGLQEAWVYRLDRR